uniref:HAT C-terminal dimerisation domain-containing protein n=1 Tax=Aegilops tauschii subsp. strangulata TaxID=200361 RepID=A0A453Q012_AEGTS
MKMVEAKKHLIFPLVYKLIELALILPVSTAFVERAFSAMKITAMKSQTGFTFVGNMASLPLFSSLIFIYPIELYFVRLLRLC